MALTVSSSVFRADSNAAPAASAEGAALLAALRTGDSRLFDALYRQLRPAFLKRLAIRFPRLSHEDHRDIYQDTFVTFSENVSSGHLTELNVLPATYLFAIALRRSFEVEKKLAKKFNLSHPMVIEEEDPSADPESDAAFLLSETTHHDPFNLDDALDDDGLARQQAFEGAWNQTRGACRELLDGYYYQGLNLNQLTDTLDYVDVDSTKTRKSQCVRRLRTLIQELLPRHLR